MVTGVGAIVGYGIIRSLRTGRYDVNIVGMDIYGDAVGQHWCDVFIRSLKAADENYCSFLSNVMSQYNIDLVFFGTEQEIYKLYDNKDHFQIDYNKLVLNKRGLIDLSRDKWEMSKYLTANNFTVIKSIIEGDYSSAANKLGLPFLLKPRCSYASKGIEKIETTEDYYYWKNKLGNNFLVQEIIGDDDHEYTIGVFGLGDGTFSQSITFQRKLSVEGSTVKAKTVNISDIDEEISKLVLLFMPVGPTNIQLRFHKGKYLLLEINPRISSSTSLRTAFGFNEADMCIEYYLESGKPRPTKIMQGSAIRYIEDLVKPD